MFVYITINCNAYEFVAVIAPIMRMVYQKVYMVMNILACPLTWSAALMLMSKLQRILTILGKSKKLAICKAVAPT